MFRIRSNSTSGDFDLFSTNMKKTNEIIPAARKIVCIVELILLVELLPTEVVFTSPLPVCKKVSSSRNDVIATANDHNYFPSRKRNLFSRL